MLGLTKKTIHAIEAVADIASQAAEEPVQMVDLSDRLGVSRRYLEPVLQRLVRNSVLKGVRGPRGGYRLARPRYEISITDILDALGPEEEEQASFSSHIGRTGVAPALADIGREIRGSLGLLTLDMICEAARKAAPDGPKGPADFVI